MRIQVAVVLAISMALLGCTESPIGPADQGQARGPAIIACGGRLSTTGPLYLVNGVIVSDGTFPTLDASRIDSIMVTKSGAATALYGSRASRGVVHIFTRQTDWRAAP